MTRHQSGAPGAFVTSFSPEPESQDLTPSDSQPPGVDQDDDDEPQSLEEALLG